MRHYYVCTKKGYCEGQARSGQCKTGYYPERMKCPHLKIVEGVAARKKEIDPRKPGVKDPETPLFWGPSLWVVQELMKERRT